MNPTEYQKIKYRHAAFDPDSLDDGDNDIESITQLHRDRDSLIKELDRFRSNYEEGLRFFDNFLAHHANVLPRATADEARALQARMRGLL